VRLITYLIDLVSIVLVAGFLVWSIAQKRSKTKPTSPLPHLPWFKMLLPNQDVNTLFSHRTPLSRRPYVALCAVLVAVHYNLLRLIGAYGFHHYSPDISTFYNDLSPTEYMVRGLVSLPFLWAVVILTLRRLRDLNLSGLWSLMLLVPFVNLIFLTLLIVLPTPSPDGETAQNNQWLRWLDRVIPDHALGSATLGVLTSLPLGLMGLIGGTHYAAYGWGLFLGLPFCLGLFSVLIYSYHRPRKLDQCLGVATIAVGLFGLALFALAIEGLICLIMAAPLGLILAVLGGAVGYALQIRHKYPKSDTLTLLLALVLSWPILTGAESKFATHPPVYPVESIMEINAPPETVWNNVVTFSQLPEPTEWVFRTGIAYPIRAKIQGRGVGAVRRCIFSTGEFVEPIEIWNEPHQLVFGVKTMPMPMHEWSYKKIHPPHLDQYLQVTHGEFRLEPLPGNRTRLIGTTWYSNKVWPSLYWKAWSDGIIHTVHLRVLRHIKNLSEKA
jgi:uncharacterized membrane protein YhaH (DUF805 family)